MTKESEILGREINYNFALQVIDALGGKDNIVKVDACITRLRVRVKELEASDETKLNALGSAGFVIVDNNIQIIFGQKSDQIKKQMKDVMEGK